MRRRSVGRTSAATSAARRPHAADLASDRSDHSDASTHAFGSETLEILKSHYNMTLVTSFDAFDARGRRIVVHSWSGKLSVGRASAAMRPTMYRPYYSTPLQFCTADGVCAKECAVSIAPPIGNPCNITIDFTLKVGK